MALIALFRSLLSIWETCTSERVVERDDLQCHAGVKSRGTRKQVGTQDLRHERRRPRLQCLVREGAILSVDDRLMPFVRIVFTAPNWSHSRHRPCGIVISTPVQPMARRGALSFCVRQRALAARLYSMIAS